MLLVLFTTLAAFILPILLPLQFIHGKGSPLSDIPSHLLNNLSLSQLYNDLPGSVYAVVINRDPEVLTRLVRLRDNAVEALEVTETKLTLAYTQRATTKKRSIA